MSSRVEWRWRDEGSSYGHSQKVVVTAPSLRGPAAETEWRAVLEHATGCLACRTPGAACSEGERLLSVYEAAARQDRSGGDAE
ncbi:hypothetical protein [Streptomyces sp. 11-1-2]|uniref:hypothetical protein n=1 Tax=unclassified Streptomyces TaxID=2593676 RepID=UPI000B8D8D92|nr:hypothetical protein [Streptomyces sp. 11-1-2]ASQ94820.1 hypothetical protein CGL27_18690 [Streptomyces sp. 11-1-2]